MKNDDSIEKEILENRGKSNVEDDNVKMIKPKVKKRKNYVKKVDKIKTKNFSNRRFILSLACVVVISLAFVIGGSFARTTTTKEGNSASKLEAGTMKLEFDNKNDTIALDNALPQDDNDAIMNNKEYSFDINNKGNLPSSYVLTLNSTCTEGNKYKVNNNDITADICIPENYIKVGLSVNDGSYNIISTNNNQNSLILDEGVLEVGGINKYKLKIWLDLSTPNTYNQKDKNVVYTANLDLKYNQVDNSNNENTSSIDNTDNSSQLDNNVTDGNISQVGE